MKKILILLLLNLFVTNIISRGEKVYVYHHDHKNFNIVYCPTPECKNKLKIDRCDQEFTIYCKKCNVSTELKKISDNEYEIIKRSKNFFGLKFNL